MSERRRGPRPVTLRIPGHIQQQTDDLLLGLRRNREHLGWTPTRVGDLGGVSPNSAVGAEQPGRDPNLLTYLRCREALRTQRPVQDHYIAFVLNNHLRAIRSARTARGLTQRDLGDLLGVEHSVISAFERLDRNRRLSTFLSLADALGVKVDGDSETSSIVP